MTDIILDINDDLSFAGGDFLTTDAVLQYQRQLLLNDKGDFKENPTTCVGALRYIDEERMTDLVRAISIELARDGMNVNKVSLTGDGTITIG